MQDTNSRLTDLVVCPACGCENIQGSDSCENCLTDLRTLDVPETSQIASDSDLLAQMTEIRLSRLLTVGVGASVREALALMRSDASGAVVVLDGSEVAGIFTERDVLKKVAAREGVLDAPVSRFMTRDPVILRDSDTIAVALNKMGDGGFRHIPLLHEGELSAMVTARDVLNWVMMRYFD